VIIADDDLRKRVNRLFHAPMIILALLVLPLLLLDYWYIREIGPAGPTRGWMWWLVIGGLTVIWIAFTLEFIIKIAIAENRWEYLRRNWVDLIVIVIPLLRPLRVAALARTTQTFRLRGVGFKLARSVFALFIGMEATNRLMHRLGVKATNARKKPEEMTRHELMCEVRRRRQLTDDWQTWYLRQQAYLQQHGYPAMASDPPTLPVSEPWAADIDAPPAQRSYHSADPRS
jgi:hypothetical protein